MLPEFDSSRGKYVVTLLHSDSVTCGQAQHKICSEFNLVKVSSSDKNQHINK